MEGSLDISLSSATSLLSKSVHNADHEQPATARNGSHGAENPTSPVNANGSSSAIGLNGSQPHASNGVNGSASRKNSSDESNQNGKSSSSYKTEWVRLNIGGKYFVTTKTTLCKYPQSFLYKLCQDDPSIGLTTDKVTSLPASFALTNYFWSSNGDLKTEGRDRRVPD